MSEMRMCPHCDWPMEEPGRAKTRSCEHCGCSVYMYSSFLIEDGEGTIIGATSGVHYWFTGEVHPMSCVLNPAMRLPTPAAEYASVEEEDADA